jgi:hypothetical protein
MYVDYPSNGFPHFIGTDDGDDGKVKPSTPERARVVSLSSPRRAPIATPSPQTTTTTTNGNLTPVSPQARSRVPSFGTPKATPPQSKLSTSPRIIATSSNNPSPQKTPTKALAQAQKQRNGSGTSQITSLSNVPFVVESPGRSSNGLESALQSAFAPASIWGDEEDEDGLDMVTNVNDAEVDEEVRARLPFTY